MWEFGEILEIDVRCEEVNVRDILVSLGGMLELGFLDILERVI